MSTNSIPQPIQPIAGGLKVDTTWYKWLRELERLANTLETNVSEQIAAIARALGSPDGSIEGIPDQQSQQLVGLSPITVAGQNISLDTLLATTTGDLQGFVRDAFGRVSGVRPVVAGPGVAIDSTTNPAQIEIRATAPAVPFVRITTDGDFRRTTQNDLRAA